MSDGSAYKDAGNPGVEPAAGPQTRMIVMGSSAICQGFALVGFETWPDADVQQLEQVMGDLLHSDARAVVLLEPYLARSKSPALRRIYSQGGHVVATEVPELHAPSEYQPPVEELVINVLGAHMLEDAEEDS